MATATEKVHTAEWLITELDGAGSRQNVTALSGQTFVSGEVLGRVTIAGVGRVSVPTVVGTGNGTASLVTAGPLVQVGNYVLTCTAAVTNGGVWKLVAPDLTTVGTFTMTPGAGGTTAFKSPHINWSLTDGSTDFAAGDVFTFVVGTTVPTTVGTGNGLISAITYGANAQTGNYRIENVSAVTNGGVWKVIAPNGSEVSSGAIVAGAGGTFVVASSGHINFTITDGSTDFVLGDYFNVAVYGPAADTKVVQWDPQPTTFDGRQNVFGVSYAAVDASAGDMRAVAMVRMAEVQAALLGFKSGLTAGQIAYGTKLLAAIGIAAR